MKIKSLLIGSAALMTASSGAYAADAIVMAEPEPVEYVRVCDVYGVGFFYIPGTETCLRIGGYYRFQIDFTLSGAATGYSPLARFAPTFDVRSENEWGTLRGFAEIEFDYRSSTVGNSVNLNHAFIEQTLGAGTLRLGKSDTPYARFLGYGSGGVYGAVYTGAMPLSGFANSNEISYTFAGGNGFSAVIALVDNQANALWATNVEGGLNFKQGWGSVGAIAGYDAVNNSWGAKAVARFGGSNGFSGGLHVFYSSGAGDYAIVAPGTGIVADWSVMGHVLFAFSPQAAARAHVQWFNLPAAFAGDRWEIAGGLDLRPVNQLRVRPEVRYRTGGGFANTWDAVLRIDREF